MSRRGHSKRDSWCFQARRSEWAGPALKQLAHWELDNAHKPEHEHDDYDGDHQTKDAAHSRFLCEGRCSRQRAVEAEAPLPGPLMSSLRRMRTLLKSSR